MKRTDLSLTAVPLGHAASVSKIQSQMLQQSANKMDRKYLQGGSLGWPTLADGCVLHPVSCPLIGCLGVSALQSVLDNVPGCCG